MRPELDPAIAGRSALFVVAAGLLATAAGAPGCSYDWTIGAPASNAGGGGSAAGGGGGASGGGTSGGGGGGSGSASGGGGGGPSCAALEAQLESARKAAKACTIGASGQCATAILDECGCDAYVTDPASAATDDFVAAIDALASADCPPDCDACLLGSGACLYSNGMGPYCLP